MDHEVPIAEIGRYRVLQQLGQGAMGRVLLAHDPVLDRDVAIKLLRDDLKIPADQKAGLVKRMRQEARASARVSHPNIVALHDMGEDDDLGLYLVFEYAAGITLKQRLQQGPLKPAAAARLARELGGALTTAHRAGVLHRDIKPDNIILTQTGAKIADFGIARVPDSTLTRDGGLLGTPAYSSPESIATGSFSPLSDQFSMAATLYEAISGVRAFPGHDAVAVATKISTEVPPPIAAQHGLPPKLDEVLLRGLAKQPDQRFADAQTFGEALAEAVAPSRRSMETIPDQRHSALETETRRRARTRLALGGAAIGALVTALAFQITLRFRQDARNQEPVTIPSEPTPPVATSEPPAIGWLAESSPKPRRKTKDPADDADEDEATPRTTTEDALPQRTAASRDPVAPPSPDTRKPAETRTKGNPRQP